MEKMSTTKLAVLGAPMWVAKRSADDWTATVGSDQAVIEDCCTDGAAILSKMNPETYHMPLGTRVVCIKTEHLNNLHIALQRGVWVVEDKVGEKINRVFEEHDADEGEKVLFLFSINRQRAFCALAEMDGPWVKGVNHLPGWQEKAGSFKTVGAIPITFTHVKNIANDHFEGIHHENPNQPITNMWNGMHFQIDKGREVVKIFHEKPHFTNVLCRDRRKRYSPFDAVTSAQVVDPTIPRKYQPPPPGRGGRTRGGHVRHAVSNWRTQTTPTRGQPPRRVERKADEATKVPTPTQQRPDKAPTPTQPRAIKRDHAPNSLNLRTPPTAPQPSPSPRPGTIIKCIVDANGNYIPIDPSEDSPRAPADTPCESGFHGFVPGVIRNSQNPRAWRQQTNIQHDTGPAGGPGPLHRLATEYHQHEKPAMTHETSMPRLFASESDTAVSEVPLCYTDPAQNLATASTSEQSDQTAITDLLLRGTMQDNSLSFGPVELPVFDTADSIMLLAAKTTPSAFHPRHIARHAYERNERVLSYENLRREQENAKISRQQNMTEGSFVSTIPSEYQDWASTSEIERMRIPPVSPLTNSDPFVVDSISKSGSPTTKAYQASVNRELRNMRQGQRAMPTPSKFTSHPDMPSTASNHRRQSPRRLDSVPTHAGVRGESTDGGVRIPSHDTGFQANIDHNKFGHQRPHNAQHRRHLSTLSGADQLPRSVLTDMNTAGQYAPVDEGFDLSALLPSLERTGAREYEHAGPTPNIDRD